MDSSSSITSPKSFNSSRIFDFDAEDTHLYIETLEKNLYHHTKLIKDIIIKMKVESFSEDSDYEIKSPVNLEKLISEIQELYKSIKTVESQRRNEVSKILINELLEHEQSQKYREIIQEYEERIQEIKFYIERRDKLIFDLQKNYSELDSESTYKQNYEDVMIVPLNQDILHIHKGIEDIRGNILNIGDTLTFAYNYKQSLINFYRKT